MEETPTTPVEPAQEETPLSPEEAMRADWNRRAEEDHKLHIATGHARTEEDFRASGEKDLVEEVLDGIELSPDAEALEIGCGVGRLLVPLSERVARAHGVDISEVMVAKSREYCAQRPNVATRVTDGRLDAFPDGSLDFVYSFIVFQHIPLREAIATYVREAGRVLAPGGLLRFQVDGRWRERAGRAADTYDGVVFAPAEVRALVDEAGLAVVDEWGEETHYHWVTAVRPGAGAEKARFVPRSYDETLLRELLGALGVAGATERAADVAAGRLGVRAALGRFEEALSALPNADFVREVLKGLLGHAPDPAGLAYHTRILDDGFEDRAALVDTVLSGAEFRQLVRPRVPRVPWPRLLAFAGAPEVPSTFETLEAAYGRIRSLPPEEAVDAGFRLLTGHPPDPVGREFNAGVVSSSVFGTRLFLRQLLFAPDAAPAPGPLSEARVGALLAALGATGALPAPHAVEAFPGEAAAAARFLARTASLSATDLVAASYEAVLGRPADEGGRAYYAGRLEDGTLSRAAFLRELLWSDEARSVRDP
jgi:SAM-dependent methyltransferase